MSSRKRLRPRVDFSDEDTPLLTDEQAARAFAQPLPLPANQSPTADMLPISIIDVNEAFYGTRAPRPTIALINGALHLGGFVCTPTGLVREDETDAPTLEHIGMLLFDLEVALPWLIGDWLIYMEATQQGDIFALAEQFNRDPKHLYNYMIVARHVEYKHRRKTLSFAHHRVVARLAPDEQVLALQHAEANMLTLTAFRKWLKSQSQ